MEGDMAQSARAAQYIQFLSTPSHGGRRGMPGTTTSSKRQFLSTPSHGGRQLTLPAGPLFDIFLSTPSHGGRLCYRRGYLYPDHFYPRPHMEGDSRDTGFLVPHYYFYPRPHMEGDIIGHILCTPFFDFYPRPHMEGDLSATSQVSKR